jgi:hypothetical protein
MAAKDELKTCPFCEGDGWVIHAPGAKRFRPQCSKCGAGFGEFDRRADAISAWNSRERDARDVDVIRSEDLVRLLPGPYYMDPPDGGDVSLHEQLKRMAKDAARYRWLRELREQTADVIGRWGAGCGEDPEYLDQAIDAALTQEQGDE